MADVHMVARDQLRSFIERIERLEAEKQTIADDIKDVYGEAKGTGFDTKILRKVISIRKMDRDERAEQEAILDTYLAALGMIPQPDLFDDEPHDAETGELSPKLAHTIVTGLQTETGRAALLTAVDIMIEREEAQERRSDGGLDIVTKHTEIASASQGEAEDHSDQRETDREAAATGAGANAGGDDVDSSAERAGPEGPSSIEPTGPVAERATHSPEEANEMDRDTEGSLEAGSAPAENARKATATVAAPDSVTHAEAGESPAPSFLTKPPSPLRPNCRNPGEACGGYGDVHCHACKQSTRALERAS